MPYRSVLYFSQVLAWADAHHRWTGRWPTVKSGRVREAHDEKWKNIDMCLRVGNRGFPGRYSLAQMLAEYRGVRNKKRLPRLTPAKILAWADAHRRRTGRWPKRDSGPIQDSPGDTWMGMNEALHQGQRGLRSGSSLARLLAARRRVRNPQGLPRLSRKRILQWADAHYRRTGSWPHADAGPIPEAPGENWRTVEKALRRARRSLRGRSSLSQLLAKYRGVQRHKRRPLLTIDQILGWADAHRRRTGHWPLANSGTVHKQPKHTWFGIDQGLREGRHGLPGSSSLMQLLFEHRGVRNHMHLPSLSVRQILTYARAHHSRTGRWPTARSGAIDGAPGETWLAIAMALSKGHRGLPRGSSLPRLLAEHCGVHKRVLRPQWNETLILGWAKAHRKRMGRWPTKDSGAIREAPGTTWSAVHQALRSGHRGLPGGFSLRRFLESNR